MVTRGYSSGNDGSPSGYPRDLALYDAFGALLADIPSASINSSAYSSAGRYRFTQGYSIGFGGQFGYYTETNTKLSPNTAAYNYDRGLILCTHRYYDPVNARWLTRDPAGYDGGINLYAYCDGNPVMRSDPSGLDADTDNFCGFLTGESKAFANFGLSMFIYRKVPDNYSPLGYHESNDVISIGSSESEHDGNEFGGVLSLVGAAFAPLAEAPTARTVKYGVVAKGLAGTTSKYGNIIVNQAYGSANKLSTLKHESVHRFFAPQQGGSVNALRAYIGNVAYDKSHLLKFTEELLAEKAGSGSWQKAFQYTKSPQLGLSTARIIAEGVGYGVGTGALIKWVYDKARRK